MRARRGIIRGLVAAIVLPSALIGPAPSAHAETVPTLRLGVTATAGSLNPFTAADPVARRATDLTYEGLVAVGADGQPAPGLAESWRVDDGGRRWTYTLGADRQWSDGQPVTAADVLYSYTVLPGIEGLRPDVAALAANIAEVVSPDPTTVVVTLVAPQAANPALGWPIVPEHVWADANSGAVSEPGTAPVVGSGPFLIAARRADGGVDLRANPLYWRGAARVAGVDLVTFPDAAAAWSALADGRLDAVTGLGPAQFDAASRTAGIVPLAGAGRSLVAAYLNPAARADGAGPVTPAPEPAGPSSDAGSPASDQASPPPEPGSPSPDQTGPAPEPAGGSWLAGIAVRQAIAAALDPVALTDDVFAGVGLPGLTGAPPGYPALSGLPAGVRPRTYGLDVAIPALRDALTALGASQDPATGRWLDAGGAPVTLRLAWPQGDPSLERVATWITGRLQSLGLTVTGNGLAATDVASILASGNVDIALATRTVPPDPDQALTPYLCADTGGLPAAPGPLGWCSQEFDSLALAQHTTMDLADRSGLVRRAYGVAYVDATELVLYYPPILEAWRADRVASVARVPATVGPVFDQVGSWGLFRVAPTRAPVEGGTTVTPAAPSFPWGPVIAAAAGLLVVILAIVWFVARREAHRVQAPPDSPEPTAQTVGDADSSADSESTAQ